MFMTDVYCIPVRRVSRASKIISEEKYVKQITRSQNLPATIFCLRKTGARRHLRWQFLIATANSERCNKSHRTEKSSAMQLKLLYIVLTIYKLCVPITYIFWILYLNIMVEGGGGGGGWLHIFFSQITNPNPGQIIYVIKMRPKAGETYIA